MLSLFVRTFIFLTFMVGYSMVIWNMVGNYFRNEFQLYLTMEKIKYDEYRKQTTTYISNNRNSITTTSKECTMQDFIKDLFLSKCITY